MSKRAYKYRFTPTPEQREHLSRVFGHTRFVYNRILRIRQDAWASQGERINYHDTSFLLTKLKAQEEYVWLREVSCTPLQQTLRHLQSAFTSFFAGRSQHPKFKRKEGRQSAEFTRSAFKWDGETLTIAKLGALDIRWSRTFTGLPSTVTLSLDPAGRYFVSMLVDEHIKPLPNISKAVGVDVGIRDVVVTSDGWKSGTPAYTRKYATKLATAQRKLAKKKKGSNNRAKAKLKVARVHAKISDSRRDFTHKLTTRLVRENQTIAVETLAVKNMVKNRRLAKSIHDSGWGELLRQLEYKAGWYGRTLVGIDRWYPSSKRCSACGYTLQKLPLDIRDWQCPECDVNHDRDTNAAVNILAAGRAVLASGESVNLVSSLGISRSQ